VLSLREEGGLIVGGLAPMPVSMIASASPPAHSVADLNCMSIDGL
jgi:hypothetical protein